MGRPLTYPVGTTMYDPSQCWNGYNLFSLPQLGTILMDMNGKPVRFWKELDGFPARLLPGGRVMGSPGSQLSGPVGPGDLRLGRPGGVVL